LGKRGPQKKPTALERLEGNPGKKLKELSGLASVEAWGEPFTPEHLMPDAKACVELIQENMPPKVYRAIDSFQLAAFGMAWAIHKRAAEEIAKKGFRFVVYNQHGSQAQSPWLKILNEQARTLVTVGGQLGLDPVSRQQLHSPVRQQESRFAGLIGPAVIPNE